MLQKTIANAEDDDRLPALNAIVPRCNVGLKTKQPIRLHNIE